MTRRRLISERDVQRAAREGAKSLDARGAILTPSAADLAARHGIAIERDAPGGSAAGHAAGKGAGGAAGGATGRARRPGTPPAGDGAAARAAIGAPAGAASPARQQPGTPAIANTIESLTPADTGASAGALPGATFRLALGADHGGVAMKDALRTFLTELGHDVVDLGTTGSGAVDYPDFAVAVARTVADGRVDLGVMVDGAGIGSCMAANKVAGVRAAMCHDVTTAANAREHNDANVLTLGGTLLGQRLAQEIVRTFLQTPFGGGRHAARVGKINALDAIRRG